jgi:hypothetical protein
MVGLFTVSQRGRPRTFPSMMQGRIQTQRLAVPFDTDQTPVLYNTPPRATARLILAGGLQV